MVTKSWGTPDQPNVQGFIKSIVGMGYGPLLQSALDHQANRYTELASRVRDPQIAMGILQSEMAIAAKEARLEEQNEAIRRQQETAKRNQLLQQRSAPQQDNSRAVTEINGLRDSTFAQYGLPVTGQTHTWFAANLREAGRLAQMAGRNDSMAALVERAVRETAQMLQAAGVQLQAPAASDNGAPPAASMPARPQAAPVPATNGYASPIPGDDGTSAGFRARRLALQQMARNTQRR